MLRELGCDEVNQAQDADEAREAIDRGRVDLLMTNWDLPGANGLELVEEVRQQAGPEPPLILLYTSRAGKEDVLRALKAGVDVYLTQPFTRSELKDKLHALLEKRAQRLIGDVLINQDPLEASDDHTLVLVGDGAATKAGLEQSENRHILRFLAGVSTHINSLNARSDSGYIGYVLAQDSPGIATALRKFGERIKLLILTTALPDSGLTIARLVSINRQAHVRIFLVCEDRGLVPEKVRLSLERINVMLVERRQLNNNGLDSLFREYLLPRVPRVASDKAVTPLQIRERLEEDVSNLVSLPILPQVYHQIAQLSRDPHSEIKEWTKALETDPLTRAQVIRRARSPLFGFRGEIGDLDQAVPLLGKNNIVELVASSALRRSFEGVEEEAFDIEGYWVHSLAVALMAQILSLPLDPAQRTARQRNDYARFALDGDALAQLERLNLAGRLPLLEGQDPFIGGIMHDIGKVALIRSYPGLLEPILDQLKARDWNVPMGMAEENLAGGAHHCEVGRILAQSWNLGESICQVVERHHTPSREDHFSQLIALADFLAAGFFPYPKVAVYPMGRLLRQGEGDNAPSPPAKRQGAKSAEPVTRQAEWDSPTSIEEVDPLERAAFFLPEGLLEWMELETEDLVDLGKALRTRYYQLVQEAVASI